ncbi:MAG: PKD domain-containing protein, partial [Verrucomicrobiota bacterium]|nr:PKD domain-containing protein [Verrucomicrobiota bacterium]
NVIGSSIPTAIGAPAQTRGDVALGTSGSMIVFRSEISGSIRIKAQPLDINGNPILAEPLLLETGPVTNSPTAPSVAWNGSLYLATWSNATGIVSQRINQNGTRVDPAPVPVMPGFGPTDVSAMGSTFLVIGRQLLNNNIQLIAPFVARVDGATGSVLDPSGIQVGNSFCVSVSVTTVGNRWLAVFRSNTTHDNPVGSTYGSFVSANGSTGTIFTIYGPSSAPGNGIVEVGCASDGTSALALQPAPLSTTSETDLIGVIVNPDGTKKPAVNLTPWLGNQYSPKATWDGSRYIVVYNDQINRFAPFTINQFDARSDLFGIRVAADGSKIDPMGFVFSASPGPESWPGVSANNGLTLIVGSVLLPTPYDSYRVGYDFFGAGGNQWPIAVAGADKKAGDTPLTVNFSSAGSTDLDGVISSYVWDFGDGATATVANPSHTYTAPGKYVVTLKVTDNLGAMTSNTVQVNVTAPNISPVAVFTFTPQSGPPPLSITLVADGSYDPDGTIGNLEWHFSDGGTYFGSPAFHTFTQAGTYTISLTVFDDRFASSTTTKTIVVGTATVPPAPTNLAARVQSKTVGGNLKSRVKLSWTDNATNESGYAIERCSGGGCSNFTPIATVAANTVSYFDKNVTAGAIYRYRVAATSSGGQSPYSNIAEATIP